MYTGELCELHGWWINLDSTIQFPTKTKTTDEFMQITTRNELHCPFPFFCFLENLCRIENTSKSIFQHIRVPLNAWHTMRCANFIYRFSNASDSQIYSNTCNHLSWVHYVRYTEHFDISLALLWDTTIMIRLIIFRTYLKIYLGVARYLVQVRIL